uniref:Uncharacterized protein LOC111133924 n=1 Tax=Crassostrea virginica TaxID=6565 RepID=A0A8B8ECJ6_CRAVI|nr:uncharacterized protein LOC111133924 [Crassostrea virginica]
MISFWKFCLLVILLFLLYLLNRRLKGTANVICPVFYMNSSTLHPEMYLSDMDTVLSNFKITDENKEVGEKQLKKFKGIVGKYLLSPDTDTKFEIGFTFNTVSSVQNNEVLLQMGVADHTVIDLFPTLGIHEKAWSVSVAGCRNEYICLIAESGGKILEKLPISENKNNTAVSRKLLFHCIPHRNTMVVSINTPKNEFVEFKGVDFKGNLLPALAAYNPKLARTTLTNIQPDDLELDITSLHRAVFMSEDNNTISNTKVNSQYSKRNVVGNLLNYKGVVGDVQFNKKFHMGLPEYFELKVEINVMAFDFGAQDHLFDVGFTHQKNTCIMVYMCKEMFDEYESFMYRDMAQWGKT